MVFPGSDIFMGDSPFGFAHHQMVFNEQGQPVDYIFLKANPAFEKLTGLKLTEIIGKGVRQVIPGILDSEFDWIGFYGNIATNGGHETFEQYFEPLSLYYQVHAFSREKGFFSVLFVDITKKKEIESVLSESEKRFRAIIENAKAGYFNIDQEGIFRDVNDAWLQMHHMETREEIIGQHFSITQVDQDMDQAKQNVDVLMSGIPIEKGEFSRKNKDGTIGYHIYSATPVVLEGRVNGIEGFIIDITEQKRAVQELKALSARQEALLQTIPDIIAEVNNNKVYTWANLAARQFFGKEMIGREASFYFEGDQETYEKVRPLFEGDTDTFYLESWQRREDGQKRLLAWWCKALKDLNGNVKGALSTARDITDQWYHEQMLAARLRMLEFSGSHDLPELLRATLDECEWLTGSQAGFYHFVEADQVSLTLQAWSTNTVNHLCKAVGAGLHYPIDQAGVWVDCIRAKKAVIHNDYASLPHKKGLPEGHAPVTRELVVPVIRNGLIVAVLGVGNKSSDYTTQDLHIMSIMADLAWDISEQKRSEILLRDNERILRELNASKDKFFSIIAHDLKSPFNSILGFSELLQSEADHLDVPDIRMYASMISKSASHTLQLLDNLLTWARMQQGKIDYSPENLILATVANEMVSLIKDTAIQKNIGVKCLIPDSMVINADMNMLATILRNLISNAVKFTVPGGMVQIEAHETPEETVILVSDTGVGIPQANLPLLFDPGACVTTRGTNNERGTGLGLTLCREFVEKHGGRISVESDPGKGSRFMVAIPKRR